MNYQDDIIAIEIKGEIMYCSMLLDKTLTKEIIEHAIEKRLAMAKGKQFKTIIIYPGKVSFTKEATKILSTRGKEGVSMVAIVFPHLMNRILGEFMLNTFYRRDEFPMKIFANENEAEEWMLKHE